MISKYNRGILLIFLFNICLSILSHAQTPKEDSTAVVPDKLQSIGYGKQLEWKVSSAISTVKGSELQKSFTTNLANTLYGRLAGLTVQQGSGEPGIGLDSPTLLSRGIATFKGSPVMLILVDGYESNFEQLASEEIESISLLKDASATAIYGSRGANGVLLVTTRRGSKGPLKISFSTQQGFQMPNKMVTFLDSYDYARLFNEALANDGSPAKYTTADLDAYKNGSDPSYHSNVNWQDEVLRKANYISNYNLNFQGGDENVRYFTLLNVITTDGLYKKVDANSLVSTSSKYSRYNIRSNIDIDLTNSLLASLTLGGSVEDKANPAGINTNSMFDLMASLPPNAFPVTNPNGSYGGNNLYSNPLGDIMQNGMYNSNARTLQSTLKLTQKLDFLTKGLSVSAAVSFNNYFLSYSTKSRTYERYSIVAGPTTGEPIYTKFGLNTSLVADETQSAQWRNAVFQSFLNYSNTFGDNEIDGMALFNSDSYTISGNNLPYKHVGGAGRITLTNNKKYIGEFSFAYNGSENFAKGKRYGFFPAASVGWIASNEDFLKGNSMISFLKIRTSYGLTGNERIGGNRFMFDQYYPYTSSYYFGSSNSESKGIAEGMPASTNITWEKEKKFNIGIEATLIKQLDVTFDYFYNNRYDILVTPNASVPEYLGFTLPLLNQGKVTNKGLEAKIRYNSKENVALQYFVEATAWYATNEITDMSEVPQMYDYLKQTGHPINQPFLLEAIGFFKDQADIDASPRQIFATSVKPGDIKYKNRNGDNIIDQLDYSAIGKTDVPELTVSFHAGMKFKGLDLDMLFQGVANRTVYLDGRYFYAFQNNAKISEIALGRWTPETASSATYPRLSAENNLNNFQPSSFWQYNGSFIKLRSLELGYTIPTFLSEKVKLSNARVFLNGTNIFSADHIDYTDPETLTGYPSIRTFSMGLKIQF